MRRIVIAGLVLLAAAGLFFAARRIPGMRAPGSGAGPTDVLGSEEVSGLVEAWRDGKMGNRIVFTGILEPHEIPEEKKPEYLKSGKVPFRFSAGLEEFKMAGDRELKKDLKGLVHYYFLDQEGKLILKESISLAKLCPS